MSNPAPTKGGSKAFLLVAVVLGILATIMAFIFIQKGGNDSSNEVTIVVAAVDLTPAKPIDPDRDLTTTKIPAKFASLMSRTLSWEGRAAYKGERVNRDVFAGQPVLLADLAAVGQLFLDKGSPYRGIQLNADVGVIIPGDIVKIVIAKPAAGSSPGVPLGPGKLPFESTIIPATGEGYKVIAVGGYTHRTRQQQLASDQYGTGSNIKTVELQVTEAQVEEIVNAVGLPSSSGQKVTLLLCPSDMTSGEPAIEKSPAPPPPATRRGP